MSEEKKREKETKVIERDGKKVRVVRYESTENWVIEDKDNG